MKTIIHSALTTSICLLLMVFFSLPANAQYIINGVYSEQNYSNHNDDLKILTYHDDSTRRYTDLPNGYTLLVPGNLSLDISLGAVRTVFENENMKMTIYYDNFENTISNTRDYIYYGNRFTKNTKDHTVTCDEYFTANGFDVHLLKWHRRKLARINNDKNYYSSIEFIKNDYEVYTILIKSTDPIDPEIEQNIISSFKPVEKQGLPRNYIRHAASQTRFNGETTGLFTRYFSPNSPLTWGIFEPSAPETLTYLDAIEDKLNYRFPFLLRYQSLSEQLPVYGLNRAYNSNRFTELTLQTVLPESVNALLSNHTHNNAGIIYDLLDGKYDEYLYEYADRLKTFGHPVLFRLNNEMNGDWCWYSAYYTAKDADIYVELWKYIYTIFAQAGVDNAIWVWNPHDVSRPDFKWNHYLNYYPGDKYVDIIGMTGYNTGTYFNGECWREFDQIYAPLYNEYTDVFDKPLMITEFSSSSVGGNKAAWIQRMFDNINKYPNIKLAIWWSGIDYDTDNQPGRIYIIDENEEIIDTFRKNLAKYRISPETPRTEKR